jgi:hypothetical protein
MPNRPKRSRPRSCPGSFTTTEELLKEMLARRPDRIEEDFWVFSILTQNEDLPTFDSAISVAGTYEQCVEAAAMILNALFAPANPIKPKIQIKSYHGDTARRILAEIPTQEASYQDALRSRPNN